MIPVPSAARVWISAGHTDMRRGMNGLSLLVQAGLKRDPFAGDLYVFRSRRGDLFKCLNTVLLISLILAARLVVSTLAAYAFARFHLIGKGIAFYAVLLRLMILPEALMVENYRTVAALGLVNTITAIGLPYMASGFGIFLLRQAFLTMPRALDDAARIEGAGALRVLWHLYLPLARPTLVAYGLVSVSYHWNNLLWPLIVTDSVSTRPITVGLLIFASPDQGVNWSLVAASSLMSSGPLLLGFLLFQRAFVQSFMRAGIKLRSPSPQAPTGLIVTSR